MRHPYGPVSIRREGRRTSVNEDTDHENGGQGVERSLRPAGAPLRSDDGDDEAGGCHDPGRAQIGQSWACSLPDARRTSRGRGKKVGAPDDRADAAQPACRNARLISADEQPWAPPQSNRASLAGPGSATRDRLRSSAGLFQGEGSPASMSGQAAPDAVDVLLDPAGTPRPRRPVQTVRPPPRRQVLQGAAAAPVPASVCSRLSIGYVKRDSHSAPPAPHEGIVVRIR